MFPPGAVIAQRYEVVRLVGQGGMSNLYLCKDRKYQNALVVIKEMTAAYADPNEQRMAVNLFHREAKLLASLSHRHIPKVYDYFQYNGNYYLSMEFVDGEDLGKKLTIHPKGMEEKLVAEWGLQMATVLYYLHVHKPPIVFRDVKPSNIMITQTGVKLIDFGIARHFDVAKKGDTMRIGSPGYAPPEQYSGQTDPRSDVYALGVTLHHGVTGRDPTCTQTPFLLPPARELNPNVSEQMAAIIARATQLDPANRYQTMLDMKRDLQAIVDPSKAKSNTRVVKGPPPKPQGSAPAGGASATVPATSPPPVPAGATQSGAAASGKTGSTPGPAQPNATPAKKKRRFPFAALLMVGLAIMSVVVPLQNPEMRDRGVKLLQKLNSQFFVPALPEDPVKAGYSLFLSGNNEAAWNRLSGLSAKERRSGAATLLRNNLSVVLSGREQLRIAALIQSDHLAGLAAAQAWLNGRGGVDGKLVTVEWSEAGDDSTIRVLNRRWQESPPEVLLDFTGTETKYTFPVVKVGGEELSDSSFPTPAPQLEPLLKGLVKTELHWMSERYPAPASAQQTKLPESSEVLQLLGSLGEHTVVLDASKAGDWLEKAGSLPVKLILLAETSEELPRAAKGTLALVRYSPFADSPLTRRYEQVAEPGPAAAEAFDALAYRGLVHGRTFRGAQVVLTDDGKVLTPGWSLYQANPDWVFKENKEVAP